MPLVVPVDLGADGEAVVKFNRVHMGEKTDWGNTCRISGQVADREGSFFIVIRLKVIVFDLVSQFLHHLDLIRRGRNLVFIGVFGLGVFLGVVDEVFF